MRQIKLKMKKIVLLLFCIHNLAVFSQKKCEYNANVNDTLGSYKATADYIIHERTFGNTQSTLFFSLINADGLPSLKVQLIQKSDGFIAAKCFDKNSKVILQLADGKIITLLGLDNPVCAESMQSGNPSENNRILTGYFLFMKDSMEPLKKSAVSILRIKYASETVDYILKSQLLSEIDKKTYYPDTYFIDYLKCID